MDIEAILYLYDANIVNDDDCVFSPSLWQRNKHVCHLIPWLLIKLLHNQSVIK